jgi:hypothetical protein
MTRDERIEAMARAAVERRGFAWVTDPMECGQDAYDICVEALDDATAAHDTLWPLAMEAVQQELRDTMPTELADLLRKLGDVEWGATAAMDADAHAAHVRQSVELTAEHFNQSGPQQMHGLYLPGAEVVVCHTGTGPNAGNIARILTAGWNWMRAAIREGAPK